MRRVQRPRVAAIGLDQIQIESIDHLCGVLRAADSLRDYLARFDLLETDILVTTGLGGEYPDGVVSAPIELPKTVNILAIGMPEDIYWMEPPPAGLYVHDFGGAQMKSLNMERETKVSASCPDPYKQLAEELAVELTKLPDPPQAVAVSGSSELEVLIETTSKKAVAVRVTMPERSVEDRRSDTYPVALLLPESANLVAWFRAFLFDLHQSDPNRVPNTPPRLGQPEDWYTPLEMQLADQIAKIEVQMTTIAKERGQLQSELLAADIQANAGIRRILWAQSDELVGATEKGIIQLTRL